MAEGTIAADELRLLIIGSCPALRAAQAQLGMTLPIPETTDTADWPALACLQAGPEAEQIRPGVLSADGGRLAYLAIQRGVQFAQSGRIQGIVTAPLSHGKDRSSHRPANTPKERR